MGIGYGNEMETRNTGRKIMKLRCYIYIRCQDSSMVRFLLIDPMVSGSSPTSAKHSLRVRRVASFVIPGVEIVKCGHTERKDLDTAR